LGLAAGVELLEHFGAGGVLEGGGAEGVMGVLLFCHEGLDHPGFETGDAALLPVAADERVYRFGSLSTSASFPLAAATKSIRLDKISH